MNEDKKPWYASWTLWVNGLVAAVAFLHDYLPLVDQILPVITDPKVSAPVVVVAIANILLRFKTKKAVSAKK